VRVKGYYRMIDKPDDSAITLAAILAPHRERTVQRMMAQQTVLCIRDGTDLNYNSLAHCEGLGVIGSNQTGVQSPGLPLHSTLVVKRMGFHWVYWVPNVKPHRVSQKRRKKSRRRPLRAKSRSKKGRTSAG
jgi:hypothetical protein